MQPPDSAPLDSVPFVAVLILHGLPAGVDVLPDRELLARLPY